MNTIQETAERARDDDLLARAMRGSRLRCPFCEYDLRAAVSVTCPECGRALTWKDFQDDRQMPRSRFVVLVLMGLSLWCAMGVLGLPLVLLIPGDMMMRAVASLTDMFVIAASVSLLVRWGMRPKLLLALPHGQRLWTTILIAPAGALIFLLVPATIALCAWCLWWA